MAATQAEPQQNDVNRDIVPQEQSPSSANISLQNGTDKSGGRGVVGSDAGGGKSMKPAQNISVDMSQYRQDSGPPVNNSEQNTNSSDDNVAKVNNSDKPYGLNAEQSAGDVNYAKFPPESGPNMQYGLPFSQRGSFMHPADSAGMHMGGEPMHHQSNSYGHYGPGMRHQYSASKPIARPGFPQQRFMPTSQGMSSPPAGTPTLNQLLQSNSVHRNPNSYGEYGIPKAGEQPPPGSMPYNQNWPPPRPMAPYSQQNAPYRNQPPPGAQGASSSGPTGNTQPVSQQSQSGASSQPGQPGIQSGGGGGGQQPGPGQPPPRSYPGYPSSPSQSPYHPPSPYRHPYQMGGGGSNGGYERGGSWSPGPGAPSSQHDHPSSPSPQQPSQSSQPPSSQHQSSYQSRGAQQSPNAHAPDPAELTGQNSNDSSSGGGGGGTPNSGGGPLRPSPSPTGSSGSRSMSPAVLPPGGNQQQGNQPQSQPGPGQSQQAPPPPQSQQGPQQGVVMPPRPPSGQSDSGNGPSRLSHSPMAQPSHSPMSQPGHGHGPMQSSHQQGPPQPPGGYQGPGPGPQHYKMGPNTPAGPGGMMGHMPSPSIPPQSQQIPPYSPQPTHHQYPQQGNYRSNPMGSYVGPASYPGGPPQTQYPPHRPPIPNHVQYPPYQQHKVGYPPSPGTYSTQAMGPPSLHPGMPPPPPPHHDGPMPPPASTSSDLHDAPSTTSAQTGTVTSSSSNSNNSCPPGVTSIVTTGPDASLDEASQQSTLSNASAASGDDTNVTTPSKGRGVASKESLVYQSSHPTTPQSTAPSPGTASLNSIHEEYPPDHSPTWSRTPNSPVFNSHVSQDLYRPKKHDSLSKLYEMDESIERRMWLDKLLQYMEERGTPISTCPTISKNPLDLFRLYIHVKERGGFMEVCKVTKNKLWKDIAGLLGIGASSSAAYTLRKHYTKNLLPFECHFDRGGIDPQPIINQVEASSKKKTTKTAPVPSPGSSNSQDSFQGPGSGSGGMDGYPGYGYPQDYNNQRPPSQTNPGVQQNYPGNYGQFGDQYNQAYGGYQGRPMYYPDPERGYGNTQQDQYRYMGGGGYPGRNYPTPPAPTGSPATPPQTTGSSPAPPPSQSPAAQPDYYRSSTEYPAAGQQYPPGGKGMPPPQPGPRRHPDFVKDQPQPPPAPPTQPQPPYPPYNQTPHRPPPPPPNMYPGWNNNSGGQYRGQFHSTPSTAGPPGWAGNSRPGTPTAGQWPPPTGGYQPGWVPPQPRPPRPQHPGFRPTHDTQPPPNSQNKQYPPIAPPPPGVKGPGGVPSSYGSCKRELIFPEGSVEGTTPVMYKRRRLCKGDVAPVDAWRIMMSLKSGLLAETTWALDVLNILLFDDSTVQYFGLLHLPGLLDILLEHMKVALQEMLEPCDEVPSDDPVDLGSVLEPPDPSSRITLLHRTPDMTLRSRKGHPISLVPAQEDLFVTDARRPWDPDDSPDREHPDLDRTKYIVATFKSEVCNIPFTRMIPGPDGPREENDADISPLRESSPCQLTPALEEIKPCDRQYKKMKSFNYALSRIKKESLKEEEETEKEEPSEKEETKVKTERDDEAETKEEDQEDEEESTEKEEPKMQEEVFNIKIKDPTGTLKRRRMSDYEDECYSKDEASLYLVTESQDWLAKRCICISTILRNLTFVPGNEAEYSKSATFLSLVGKLLLLHHEHPPRQPKQRNYDRDEDADTGDSCSSLAPPTHWWWDFLHHLRENALVSLANISGQVDLGLYPEEVSRPILDGLLHWAVCPAAHGQDPFPTVSVASSLSPQRLALEALCKLCVTDSNVDLVIATPPYCRLERLASVLTRLLCRSEEQVLREFGVNLLFYLGAADSGMSRTIALQAPCVSLLVGFIEQAENGAVQVANASGLGALRENPDQAMGTSVDMVRRACRALLALSRHPGNKPLIQQHEQRLLHLVMSQVLDQSAAQTLARVLYQVSRPNPPTTPPPT